jgi:hypothetical protein
MTNINKAEKNNDCEHQQSLGEQQPCTPIKPKENMTMNIIKNEQKHEGHTMKSEDHHCML